MRGKGNIKRYLEVLWGIILTVFLLTPVFLRCSEATNEVLDTDGGIREDIILKDVKNEDAKNDVEDIKDIEDIKDDIEDIKDAGADDISDIGEDVEDIISDGDILNDLDAYEGDVISDIDTADDISDTGPQNYECLVTTEDLDKNKIDIIYRYYNNENSLSCDTPISSISSIEIYVPAGIEQNFEKPPFGMAKKGINICLPKHDSCNTIADEQNRTDENNDYSFSNGVRLQFQLITPYEENKQDPLKLFFVVPRIAAYLKCKNGGPIPDPDYTYIDDVLYACRAVGNLPPLGGDMAFYYVFANAKDDIGNIYLTIGTVRCGPDGKCGKQYRINIEKQITYLTTIWKGGVIMQEGEPIKIAYPASTQFPLPNENGQPVSINNHTWRVTEIIIEKVEKTDNSPAKYILKGIKINKE